jgi:hypothetical protein
MKIDKLPADEGELAPVFDRFSRSHRINTFSQIPSFAALRVALAAYP